MNTQKRFDVSQRGRAPLAFFLCLAILIAAVVIGSRVQTDSGRVAVTNVTYKNEFGVLVRAKLFKPSSASPETPVPGIVFIHGYQSSRETGDAVCIELARRGVVALSIDAIGRGNSGLPGDDPEAVDFDETFGGRASFEKLKSYHFVKADAQPEPCARVAGVGLRRLKVHLDGVLVLAFLDELSCLPEQVSCLGHGLRLPENGAYCGAGAAAGPGRSGCA